MEGKPVNDPTITHPGYGSTFTPASPSANGGLANYSYEELSNGFTCPTCQGTGKIPRGQEEDLVALIPYNDARLKPRRTLRYVVLSIFGCAALAGILIAFLLPRPIEFHQNGQVRTVATSYNATIPQLVLNLETEFDMYNYNFVPLNGQLLTLSVKWSEQAIGTNITTVNDTLGGRRSLQLPGNVTAILTESVLISHCVDGLGTHLVYMQFMATFQYELMSQDQQSNVIFYKAVTCALV